MVPSWIHKYARYRCQPPSSSSRTPHPLNQPLNPSTPQPSSTPSPPPGWKHRNVHGDALRRNPRLEVRPASSQPQRAGGGGRDARAAQGLCLSLIGGAESAWDADATAAPWRWRSSCSRAPATRGGAGARTWKVRGARSRGAVTQSASATAPTAARARTLRSRWPRSRASREPERAPEHRRRLRVHALSLRRVLRGGSRKAALRATLCESKSIVVLILSPRRRAAAGRPASAPGTHAEERVTRRGCTPRAAVPPRRRPPSRAAAASPASPGRRRRPARRLAPPPPLPPPPPPPAPAPPLPPPRP